MPKISALPPATPPTGSEVIAAVQSGQTVGLPLSRLSFYYSIFNTGAIGDGTSHPLSTKFATLVTAQAVYPAALSLSEEIDFNAVRQAMTNVANLGGGTVWIPLGTFMMNNAAAPNCFLQLPECRPTGTPGVEVNLQGTGWRSSVLQWPTDTGTNGSSFALSCGNPAGTLANSLGRYNATAYYEGYLMDLQLAGPSAGHTITPGVSPANLTGFAWGSRRRVYRCAFYGFYAGIDFVGDWSLFESVYCQYNNYGMYFPCKSNFLFGNTEFLKCMSVGNATAAIALGGGAAGAAGYLRGEFLGCFIGGSPYGIMMEVGTAPTIANIITTFKDCQFESLGNAQIADLNGITALGGSGTKRLTLLSTTFESCTLSLTGSQTVTTSGQGNFDMVNAHQLKLCKYINCATVFAGSLSMFTVDTVNGLDIEGDLSGVQALSVPILVSTTQADTMNLRDTNVGWAGHVGQLHPTATCVAGNCIEYQNGTVLRPCTAAQNALAGIAMANCPTLGQYVPLATRGLRIPVTGNGSVTSNNFVKKDVGGGVLIATGPDDGFLVGFAESTNGTSFLVSLASKYMIGNSP